MATCTRSGYNPARLSGEDNHCWNSSWMPKKRDRKNKHGGGAYCALVVSAANAFESRRRPIVPGGVSRLLADRRHPILATRCRDIPAAIECKRDIQDRL